MKNIYLLAFVLMFTNACTKTESFPIEPIITFISITPNVAIEGRDSIKLVFNFTDGDGDLGLNKQDTSTDVFITDIRGSLRTPFNYRLPNITPIGTIKAIKGEVQIVIESPFRRPTRLIDSVYYEIQIRDRANNFSNKLTTPVITIVAQ